MSLTKQHYSNESMGKLKSGTTRLTLFVTILVRVSHLGSLYTKSIGCYVFCFPYLVLKGIVTLFDNLVKARRCLCIN